MFRWTYDKGFSAVEDDSSPSAPPQRASFVKDDAEWNRTLFPTDKAAMLFKVFEMMQPCINKCIFNRFGSVNEMMLNYCYVYEEVHCIIAKNIKRTGYPPSVFSAAIHQYVMHQGLNKDPTWRILCGVFEYTAMEMSAQLSALKAQREMKEREVKTKPEGEAAAMFQEWLRHFSGRHPHEMIQETHEKVHASHDKLEEMDRKLQQLIEQMQSMKKA